jgi:hypothetical protein
VHAAWPAYPYAAVIALATIIMVLLAEHLVSMLYERQLRRSLAALQPEPAICLGELSGQLLLAY